jgi:eukaryotic-like serine/threonine-protein kinase
VTRREPPENPTRREGKGSTTRLNLPEELAGRYFPVNELDSGSEAFVLRVEDSAGNQFVVKLYHPKLTFDEDALTLLAGCKSPRILKVFKEGRSADNGARYEVLEWCPYGSLRDLLAESSGVNVVDVVSQLNEALTDIHNLRSAQDVEGTRLLHQDIKPENVMVRSFDPLNLALGDFGLVRMIAGSRHYTNRQQGSRAYSPPSGEALSVGWDYWALGMLIVEVTGHEHPFRANGEWLPETVISDLLSQRSVDVSMISDDRVRALCQGLLTRRTADRWGSAEVQRWLRGEDVPLARDVYGNSGARDRTVLFNSVEFSDPAELALALQGDWDRAQEQIIQRTDGGVLSQQVGLLLGAYGMIESQQLLADTANPPTRLANLLLSLNSNLPPIYKGKDIRPEVILAGLGDTSTAPQYLDLLEDRRYGLVHTGILTCWRTLEGMSTGPAIETRIREAFTFLQQQERLTQAHLDQIGIEQLKTAIYAVALNAGSEHTARTSLADTDSTLASRQSWWTELATDPNDFAKILALHTEHAAREQTNRDDFRAATEKKERDRQEKETARRASLQRQVDALAIEIKREHGKARPVRSAVLAFLYLSFGIPAPFLIFVEVFKMNVDEGKWLWLGVLANLAFIAVWVIRRRTKSARISSLVREREATLVDLQNHEASRSHR